MPARTRERIEPTDDWSQLQLRLDWPEQTRYELIRPVVVFGHSPADRAKLTGRSTSTIYRQAARFDQLGMASLFETAERPESKRLLPPNIRRAIVQLKAEYPAFRPNELATICYVRFNRRPSSHTIQKILADEPQPVLSGRRFAPYAEILSRQAAQSVRCTTAGGITMLARLLFALLLAVWPGAVSAGNLLITALEIAEAMRECTPITSIEVSGDYATLHFENYQWDGGTIMLNDQFMMGNTVQAIHPTHPEWAIVFARNSWQLDQSFEGMIVRARRDQTITCFESTFPMSS